MEMSSLSCFISVCLSLKILLDHVRNYFILCFSVKQGSIFVISQFVVGLLIVNFLMNAFYQNVALVENKRKPFFHAKPQGVNWLNMSSLKIPKLISFFF